MLKYPHVKNDSWPEFFLDIEKPFCETCERGRNKGESDPTSIGCLSLTQGKSQPSLGQIVERLGWDWGLALKKKKKASAKLRFGKKEVFLDPRSLSTY